MRQHRVMKTRSAHRTICLAAGIGIFASALPASDRSCAPFEALFADEQGLRDVAGTRPANWASFLAHAVGTPERDSANQGCSSPVDAPAQVACSWQFQLGAPEAAETYRDVFLALSDCLGPAATVARDQGVNHPDYYDAYLIEFPAYRLTLSIKDKSALGTTFVTLRAYSEP